MKRRDFLYCLSFLLARPHMGLPLLQNSYSFNPSKVLINPGHNKDVYKHGYGCYMNGVGYEYVLNTRIAEKLQKRLGSAGLEAVISRNDDDYLPEINNYKKKHKKNLQSKINAFRRSGKSTSHMPLNEVINQVAILEWSATQGFDLMLNIHINDPGEKYRGKFSGFSVIISNMNSFSNKSKDLAQQVYDSLSLSFKPSNNKGESTLMKKGRQKLYVPGFMIRDHLLLGNHFLSPSFPCVTVECGYISQKYKDNNGDMSLSIAHEKVQDLYDLRISEGIFGFFQES